MLAYWFFYTLSAIPPLIRIKRRGVQTLVWNSLALLFILVIGLRHEVGGDWANYLKHYNMMIGVPISWALGGEDPGYKLINWIMARLELGVYGVNTVCATIFVLGLFSYCRRLPIPWLGLVVAVPYLLIVMAMGYTRQSVALGFFFFSLVAMENGRFLRYMVWTTLGAAFHKSAVLLVPMGILVTQQRGWFWYTLATIAAAYGLWDLFLKEHQSHLWHFYVDREMESRGAEVRVLMNLGPSILLLLYSHRWKKLFPAYAFWFWLSILSIVSFFLVDYASTAVDRISLYFTPIQVSVLARLPILAHKRFSPQFLRVIIVMIYAAVLFVWMNYSSHARFWLPYRNFLLLW